MFGHSQRNKLLLHNTELLRPLFMQKSGTSSAKYATRSALWLAEMHKAKGQYREAAIVLFRSSTEVYYHFGRLLILIENRLQYTSASVVRKMT